MVNINKIERKKERKKEALTLSKIRGRTRIRFEYNN